MLKKKIDFKKKIKGISKNHLNAYGNSIRQEILNNTRSGIDKDGKRFKQYSQSYKQQIKSGNNPYKNSTKVNLQSSGQMLRNVDFKTVRNGIKFFIKGSRKKGLTNNDVAYYNALKGREFLGLPKKRESKIKNELLEIYAKALRS